MKIYTFYRIDSGKIRIGAISFFDAVQLLESIDPWCGLHYNLFEYNFEEIYNEEIVYQILNYDIRYKEFPMFISEENYWKIQEKYHNLSSKEIIKRKIKDLSMTYDKSNACSLGFINHHFPEFTKTENDKSTMGA